MVFGSGLAKTGFELAKTGYELADFVGGCRTPVHKYANVCTGARGTGARRRRRINAPCFTIISNYRSQHSCHEHSILLSMDYEMTGAGGRRKATTVAERSSSAMVLFDKVLLSMDFQCYENLVAEIKENKIIKRDLQRRSIPEIQNVPTKLHEQQGFIL